MVSFWTKTGKFVITFLSLKSNTNIWAKILYAFVTPSFVENLSTTSSAKAKDKAKASPPEIFPKS